MEHRNVMTDAQLEENLKRSRFPRVDKPSIEAHIEKVEYLVLPESTVTICNIVLDCGYSVRGESACVDQRNFNIDIGRKLAYDDAFRKLWPLYGFLLAVYTHNDANPVPRDFGSQTIEN
jgi:hypothetical protein